MAQETSIWLGTGITTGIRYKLTHEYLKNAGWFLLGSHRAKWIIWGTPILGNLHMTGIIYTWVKLWKNRSLKKTTISGEAIRPGSGTAHGLPAEPAVWMYVHWIEIYVYIYICICGLYKQISIYKRNDEYIYIFMYTYCIYILYIHIVYTYCTHLFTMYSWKICDISSRCTMYYQTSTWYVYKYIHNMCICSIYEYTQ